MLQFLANAFRTISAIALVVFAIAVAPTVGEAFAHSRTTIDEPAKLDLPLADQSCAAFDAWFLDPTCRQTHVKKVANEASASSQLSWGARRVRMGGDRGSFRPTKKPPIRSTPTGATSTRSRSGVGMGSALSSCCSLATVSPRRTASSSVLYRENVQWQPCSLDTQYRTTRLDGRPTTISPRSRRRKP